MTSRYRKAVLPALAILSVVSLAGCGSTSPASSTSSSSINYSKSSSSNPTTLTLYTHLSGSVHNIWTYYLIPAFEKKYPNVKVNVTFGSGSTDSSVMDRITAAIKNNQPSPYDLIDPSQIITPLTQLNEMQKLDSSNVPLIKDVVPSFLKQTDGQSLPFRSSWVVLAYNSNDVKNPPTTLTGLETWIKQNPGHFTYNSPDTGGAGDAFVETVVNSFVPAKDENTLVNGYDPSLESDWNKGLDYLKSMGQYMYRGGFYPQGNSGAQNLLANSSIWMTPLWSDGATAALQSGALPPYVKLIQPTPAFNGGPATIGVPENSAHKQAADEFLNFLLTPEAQSMIVQDEGEFPGIEWKLLPKSLQDEFSSINKYTPAPWYSDKFGKDLSKMWESKVPQH